ncbi:MAG TPA: lactate utilization protein [Verrucomicrobiae bacterium]
MSERENLFARIREALSASPGSGLAPVSSLSSAPGGARQGASPAAGFRQSLPPAGTTPEQRLELFRANAASLKADFSVVTDLTEAAALVRRLRDVEGWKKVAHHAGQLVEPVCQSLSLPLCRTDQPYNVRELESCGAGISECDALVAQTGSVLVTTRSAGGRALSVLPPHHVVLARASQMLADLPDALAFLKTRYAPNYPSFISFITGPSRTGDIERILVLGAHGPRKLTIILLTTA